MGSESIAVVTGATAGIGLETARGLARRGTRVAMIARDRRRGEEARRRLAAQSSEHAVDLFVADLSSQAEIRALAADLCARFARIDVLINNAAVVYSRRTLSEDGVEMQLAVNHLAPFLLTHLLLDRLRSAPRARIVNVTSRAHARGRIDFDDLYGDRRYFGLTAYNQSKLANVLFTYELARRLAGTNVTANCVHPGVVRTAIGHKHTTRFHGFLHSLLCLFGRRPDEAARGVLHVACAPELDGVSGRYFAAGHPRASSPATYDEALAARLWQVSAELTRLPRE